MINCQEYRPLENRLNDGGNSRDPVPRPSHTGRVQEVNGKKYAKLQDNLSFIKFQNSCRRGSFVIAVFATEET